MNRYTRWAAALAILPIAACATATPPAPMAPPAPPPLASADASFVTSAAQGNMAEIQDAQLAQSMARNPKVKMFASKMITDHTAASDQLKQIAMSKGVTLPTQIDDMQTQQMQALQGLKGGMFDREYIAGQISDHKAMLTLFQAEAANGTDPDLKKFASDTAPTIQQHLDMAQKMVAHAQHHMRMHHHMKAAADSTSSN